MRRRNSQTGSSLLELTIGFPFMMLLLMGVIDLGRAFHSAITLQGAAQAGAQRGITDLAYANNAAAQEKAGLSDTQDLDGVTVQASKYCQCGTGPQVACTTTCTWTKLRVYVRVTATQDFRTLVSYPGVPDHVALKSIVTMRAQ